MGTDIVYEIARYGAQGDEEKLLERAEVARTAEGYRWRRVDGREVTDSDITALIRSHSELNEVRADQFTRITASPEVEAELPLLLTLPGDREDFDEAAWSETLRLETHRRGPAAQCALPRASCERKAVVRLAYQRQRSVPARGLGRRRVHGLLGGAVVHRNREQAVRHRQDRTRPCHPDRGCRHHHPGSRTGRIQENVRVWRRDGTVEGDATIFLDWLLDKPLEEHWGLSMGHVLARIFAEAALNDRANRPVWGDYLAAGEGFQPDIGATPSAEWCLDLPVGDAVVAKALDLMAARSKELSDIVTTLREPGSKAGRERRARLEELGY